MAFYIENIDINFGHRKEHALDTELARTFLTIVTAGNFIRAADQLHVTQSTVSSRIHALEDALGCKLFVRNKAGTTLTPAGKQFEKHASTLVRTIEQARHDVGVPRGFREALTVGGRFGLWEQLLQKWLPLMRARAPDVSLRAEIGFEENLMQGLIEGRLDIGVMYTPQIRPGLKIERLFDEKLILVSTSPRSRPEPGPDYVYIDLGPEFYRQHTTNFPDFLGPALTANIVWLGLQFILENGGAGYFPQRIVQPHLDTGELTHLQEAPAFTLPAHVVYVAEADREALDIALGSIREVAEMESGQSGEPRGREGA